MKHSLFFCLFLLASVLTYAQENGRTKKPQKYTIIDSSLFLKGKNIHRAGAIMMIGGSGTFLLGTVIMIVAYAEGASETPFYVGAVMFFGGALTAIASIPLIIIGHAKMDKSRVRLTTQQTFIQPLPRIAMRMPSVGITISL